MNESSDTAREIPESGTDVDGAKSSLGGRYGGQGVGVRGYRIGGQSQRYIASNDFARGSRAQKVSRPKVAA